MILKIKIYIATACAALFLSAPVFANGFKSPSGNILCYVSEYNASGEPVNITDAPLRCIIVQTNWNPPINPDPECDLDQTPMLTLPKSGEPVEQMACHGDVFWPLVGAISYAAQWTLLGYDCAMATTGVTCRNDTGNSISLARSTRQLR